MDFDLLPDEQVLSQSQNGNLILTNQRLVSIVKGFFGKVKSVDSYYFDDISVLSGIPRVECFKKDFMSYLLRIGFKTGMKDFEIDDGNKRITSQWVNLIFNAITGHDSPNVSSAPDGLSRGVAVAADSIKSVVDAFKKSFSADDNKKLEQSTCFCISCGSRLNGYKGQAVKCPYCGNSQVIP